MGYELDQLMRQYGVATPGVVPYSGAIQPIAPAAQAGPPNPNANPAAAETAYQAALAKYNADQATYNRYVQDYKNRIANTPQYLHSQYDTSGLATSAPIMTFSPAQMRDLSPQGKSIEALNTDIRNWFAANPNATQADVAAAKQKFGVYDQDVRNAMGQNFQYGDSQPVGFGSLGMRRANAPGGTGTQAYYQAIRDWIAANPNATDAQIEAEKAKHYVSNRDVYNATGSYYGNILRAPNYNALPVTTGGTTTGGTTTGGTTTGGTTTGGTTTGGTTTGGTTTAANTYTKADGTKITLPGNWSNLSKASQIAWMNSNKISEEDLRVNKFTQADIDYLKREGFIPYQLVITPTGEVLPPITFQLNDNSTTQQQGAELNRLLNLGYTDAQIRQAAEKRYGPINDASWAAIYAASNPPPPDEPFFYGKKGGLHSLYRKYSTGGTVRRFRFGGDEGENERNSRSGLVDEDEYLRRRQLERDQATPVRSYSVPDVVGHERVERGVDVPPLPLPGGRGTVPELARTTDRQPPAGAPVTASPAVRPLASPVAGATPVSPAAADLMAMLQRYTTVESPYAEDIRKARTKLETESKAFETLLARAMKPGSTAPDKTELYFRLAAAFGSPSKTGHLTENIALAGREAADYAKDLRTAKKSEQQLALQLGLEAQKMRMQGAREELTALRGLAGEEMKDRRAILLEYIKSGKPQSEAGKAAVDAGLVQGTPEFNEFVKKYLEEKIFSGNAFKEAMVAIAAGNLEVRRSTEQRAESTRQSTDLREERKEQREERRDLREERKEQRAQQNAGKLTAPELKLKSETEDRLQSVETAMLDLSRAYDLNKNSFDTTLKDSFTRKLLEETGSKDPRVINTRELENLLKSAMISSAAEKMKGVLSDSDIRLLQSVAGLDAKSKTEREQILKNAYRTLRNARTAQRKRLNDITSGLYRETSPAAAGLGED